MISQNNLMLGDYVEFNHQITTIEGLDLEWGIAVADNDNEILEEELEPIKLTPEILEANGFKNNFLGYWQSKEADSLGQHMHINLGYYGAPFISGSMEDLIIFNIWYVHELQHIFNFLGIKKPLKL